MKARDSVVWITGATGGLGRETALLCAKSAATLVLSSRSEEALESLATECKAAGALAAAAQPFDVRDPSAVQAAATEIHARFGRLDGFVTCAADVPVGSLDSLMIEDWENGIASKLLATISGLRAVLPIMREQRRGRAVVLSGIRGTEPSPQSILAGAVNAALNNIVKALSREFARHNVTISAVSPSLVMTRRGERILATESQQTGRSVEMIRAEMVEALPSGRLVAASEIAAVIVELLFSMPDAFTGQNLIVDGSELHGFR